MREESRDSREDGGDGERRSREIREFKEFSEFGEALSTFIHKAQPLILSLNSLFSLSSLFSLYPCPSISALFLARRPYHKKLYFTAINKSMSNRQFVDILKLIAKAYATGNGGNLNIGKCLEAVLEVEECCLALDRGRYSDDNLLDLSR